MKRASSAAGTGVPAFKMLLITAIRPAALAPPAMPARIASTSSRRDTRKSTIKSLTVVFILSVEFLIACRPSAPVERHLNPALRLERQGRYGRDADAGHGGDVEVLDDRREDARRVHAGKGRANAQPWPVAEGKVGVLARTLWAVVGPALRQ